MRIVPLSKGGLFMFKDLSYFERVRLCWLKSSQKASDFIFKAAVGSTKSGPSGSEKLVDSQLVNSNASGEHRLVSASASLHC